MTRAERAILDFIKLHTLYRKHMYRTYRKPGYYSKPKYILRDIMTVCDCGHIYSSDIFDHNRYYIEDDIPEEIPADIIKRVKVYLRYNMPKPCGESIGPDSYYDRIVPAKMNGKKYLILDDEKFAQLEEYRKYTHGTKSLIIKYNKSVRDYKRS